LGHEVWVGSFSGVCSVVLFSMMSFSTRWKPRGSLSPLRARVLIYPSSSVRFKVSCLLPAWTIRLLPSLREAASMTYSLLACRSIFGMPMSLLPLPRPRCGVSFSGNMRRRPRLVIRAIKVSCCGLMG